MCLDSLDSSLAVCDPAEEDNFVKINGWKIGWINSRSKTLKFDFLYTQSSIPCNEWATAEHSLLLTLKNERYTSGFHIYLEKPRELWLRNIRSVRIVRVVGRLPIAWGWQKWGEQNLPTVVCRELLVPSKQPKPTKRTKRGRKCA